MGSSKKVTIGYKIFLGLQFILCRGPVDAVRRVRVDEKNIFEGYQEEGQITVDKENLFGGKKQEGGISGTFDMEFGLPTQTTNDYLVSKLGEDIPAYRGVVGAVLRQMYLGTQPYIKKWDFRLQRIFIRQDGEQQWYPSKAGIPVGESSGLTIATTELFDATLASANETGGAGQNYQISGASTSDILHIKPTFNPPSGYDGFSYLPSGEDIDPEAWWAYTTSVYFNGARTEYWSTRYPEKSQAYDAALAEPVTITGATDYTIFIYDPQPSNNRDGISLDITLAGEYDMNPSHIIRECLTDPDWGMGYPEEDIDNDEFRRAADTLYDESFGLSLVWDRQKPIEDFISDILEHIDAALYVSKTTGKFVLKLIRNDYNETGLTRLDEDSVERVDDYSKVAFGELVNSVSVVFYNRSISKEDSVPIQDIALVQQQGVVIETTRQYPGITNKNLASRVAERDLKALSTQLISCTVYADRTAANINIGDAFILDWPDCDIDSFIMRCQEISYGDGRTNKIKIKCVQDIFDTPSTTYLGDVPEIPTTLIEDAVAASPRLVFEAPYYMLVRNLGEADTNSIISTNNFAGYLTAAAGRSSQGHLNAELWVDDGSGIYADEGTLDFCPWGIPAPESASYILDKTTTFIQLDEGFDLDQVTTPTYCQMGNEIMRVDSLSENSDGRWEMTVGRGCLDTTPQEHTIDSSGQYIFFYEDLNGFSNKEFNEGETANAKILTNTLTDQLLLAQAPTDSLLFRKRAYLPYPPGQLKINGEYYPDSVVADSGDNVLVEWAHRDRLQQTSATIFDHTEGDIGPEAGTTYKVRLYDGDNDLDSEQAGITITSAGVDLSQIATSTARIDVVSVRDGVESWQAASHTFEWNLLDSGLSESQPFDSAGSTYIVDAFSGVAMAYSVRKLREAQTLCMRVRRASDNTEQDIGFVGNDLDTASLSAFIGASNASVSTWYDQSGNGRNAVWSGARPGIATAGVISTQNGIPALLFGASGNQHMEVDLSGGAIDLNPRSWSLVCKQDAGSEDKRAFSFQPATGADFSQNDAFEFQSQNAGANRNFGVFGQTSTTYAIQKNTPAAVPNGHYFERVDASDGSLYQDNALIGTDSDVSGFTTNATYLLIGMGYISGRTNNWNGNIQELIYWESDQAANRTDIHTDVQGYFGTP